MGSFPSMPPPIPSQSKPASVLPSDSVSLSINGKTYTESDVSPELSLCDYIRKTAFLTGTKKSCAEGGCGACTVLHTDFDETKQQQVSVSVNSCLRPVLAC